MSQCRKNGAPHILSKYLLIFSVGIFLLCLSAKAIAQAPPDDPRLSHDRPQPPEHPKPPSLKKMFSKINIFKKNKDSATDNGNKNTPSSTTTAATTGNKSDRVATTSNKKSDQAATTTEPQPVGIKPTTNATANTTPTVSPMGKPVSAKKKTKKTTKPATSTKTTATAPVI